MAAREFSGGFRLAGDLRPGRAESGSKKVGAVILSTFSEIALAQNVRSWEE